MSRKRPRGRPQHDDILTPAEWRIAHAVRHGMSNRTIADQRGISIDAVKFHITNILGKTALKDRKALQHWVGAPKGTEMAKEPGQTRIGPIGQLSRAVSNIIESEKWYRDILGLPHLYTFGNLAFFDCQGTRLMLSAGEQAPTNQTVIYFSVSDIHTAYTELSARGIAFTNAPHMIHRHDNGIEEWMAFFNDPDNRPLALMSRIKPGSETGDPQ